MKVWTVSELDNVVGSLQALVGTRLQEVQTTASDVVLGFYSSNGLLWLWIDLNAVRPGLLPWTELPLRLKSIKSPLHLFLRVHFVDRVVRSIYRNHEAGRVIQIVFGNAEDVDAPALEIRLFPHGRNVLARAAGKQVAWQKPKPMAVAAALEPAPPLAGKIPQRSLDELREQWLAARNIKGGKRGSAADVREQLRADLGRKEKAYAKVLQELDRKRDMPWKQVGDWLKAHQSLAVPAEWEPFVDKRRKLSWNIEQCYGKAREIEGKLFGTEQRLEILRNEMARVRELLEKPASELPSEPQRRPPRPLKDLGAEGRTLHLSDDMMVVVGKSAGDNLKLLRKARAWDLWIHLRDYPSAHAILFRNKNAQVGDTILQQVAAWFVRQHLGHKYAQSAGERFQLLVAECRHVRPIKGDKLGRVTYHDERTIAFRVPGRE